MALNNEAARKSPMHAITTSSKAQRELYVSTRSEDDARPQQTTTGSGTNFEGAR